MKAAHYERNFHINTFDKLRIAGSVRGRRQGHVMHEEAIVAALAEIVDSRLSLSYLSFGPHPDCPKAPDGSLNKRPRRAQAQLVRYATPLSRQGY